MGLLNIIRRMALREKLPFREIARRTGMSRNTIKKYLNAGTIEPQFATPGRQIKLDPVSEKLASSIAWSIWLSVVRVFGSNGGLN
jgi:transposase